jgi:hypothetical protein
MALLFKLHPPAGGEVRVETKMSIIKRATSPTPRMMSFWPTLNRCFCNEYRPVRAFRPSVSCRCFRSSSHIYSLPRSGGIHILHLLIPGYKLFVARSMKYTAQTGVFRVTPGVLRFSHRPTLAKVMARSAQAFKQVIFQLRPAIDQAEGPVIQLAAPHIFVMRFRQVFQHLVAGQL